MLKSWKCAQSVKSALLKSNLNDQQLKIMLGCDNVMTGRDVAGLQDAEKITITLQMEGKSICVESVETGPASRTVRCEEERWYHPHSANYFHVIIIAIIDMFLSSLQSVKIFSSSIYVSNELSTIRNNYSECRAKGEDWPGPEEYWPAVSWFESFYLSESEYFCSIPQVLQLRCSRHSDNQVRGLVDVSHRSSSNQLSLKTVPNFINPSDMLQPTQCTTQRSLKTKMRKFSVKTKLLRNFSWTFTIFSMVTCSNNNQSIMQEEDWMQDCNIMKIKNLFLSAADLYLHLQNLVDGWRNPYSL